MKNFLIALICCIAINICIISGIAEESQFKTSTYGLSVVDPTPLTNPSGAYFPGFRGGDQLIEYTPAFGKYTGTNEYGTEVTVVNGIVTDKNGSNSPIPAKGYVLSGHGKAKKWLNAYTIIGTQITIDEAKNTITAKTTPESYIYAANNLFKDSKNKLALAQKSKSKLNLTEAKTLLDKAYENISQAKQLLKKNKNDDVVKSAQLAYNKALRAYYSLMIPRNNESRGIWCRPIEKTKEDVEKNVQKLAAAGIKTIYLETFYNGYTIYPSEVAESYNFGDQRNEFKGFDPLKAYIDAAHAHKMQIYVWIETFYVGSGKPGNILGSKPEWANIQKSAAEKNPDKLIASTVEPGAFFLDPANPEARNYVIKIVSEIVKKYNIDGVNLDYIRYPNSLPDYFPHYLDTTWGFSDLARKEFMNQYKTDPIELTPQSFLWKNWISYRQNKVTTIVKDISKSIKSIKPSMKLSTVVFPDEKEAQIQKLQNWKLWVDQKYVDILTPIILGSSPEFVSAETRLIKNSAKNGVKVYIGVFGPFNNDLPIIFARQIEAAQNAGADGINIFDAAHLSQPYRETLIQGAFKNNSKPLK